MRLSGFCIVLFALHAWGQLSAQGPQPLYNGQPVSAIDLIGNPHRDMEPLRPLVVQKAGEPYAQEKVEGSIAALQGTGLFQKVQVTVFPDPSGLRLNFLLEPAYYLGMVTFPGAIKEFSYTRLLQVVNLPDEDPYDKARVDVAQEALKEYLDHNGYFQSVVTTDTQIDDPHQIVHVTFTVILGKRARVANVTLQGPEGAENARLLHSMRSLRARFTGGLLNKGKPYTPERIAAATALIRRNLSQQHRLASHVEESPPQYHQETNRVDVSYKVNVGPLVTVRITDARLSLLPFMSGRQMKRLIPIYSEGVIDRDLIREGQQNLIDYFQKKGYF